MAETLEGAIEISEESMLFIVSHILAIGKISYEEDFANQKIIGKVIHHIIKLPKASPKLLRCLSDCAEYMKIKGHEGHFAAAKIYAESQRRSKRQS